MAPTTSSNKMWDVKKCLMFRSIYQRRGESAIATTWGKNFLPLERLRFINKRRRSSDIVVNNLQSDIAARKVRDARDPTWFEIDDSTFIIVAKNKLLRCFRLPSLPKQANCVFFGQKEKYFAATARPLKAVIEKTVFYFWRQRKRAVDAIFYFRITDSVTRSSCYGKCYFKNHAENFQTDWFQNSAFNALG